MRVLLPKELEVLRREGAKSKLPAEVIAAFRKKIQFIEACLTEQDMRNWKSLHYEKLQGDRKHQRSVRLNDKWRLILELDESTAPPTIRGIAIEDYH